MMLRFYTVPVLKAPLSIKFLAYFLVLYTSLTRASEETKKSVFKNMFT